VDGFVADVLLWVVIDEDATGNLSGQCESAASSRLAH